MAFLDSIKDLARANKKTIVLPESFDLRTLEATEEIIREQIADVILVGNEEKIKATSSFDVSGATFIDPDNYEKYDELVDTLVEVRKKKGLTREGAKELLLNPLYFGVMLVKTNVADGMVAGALNATGDVLRPALQIIKTAPDAKIVSSFFIMDVHNKEFGADGLLAFADCAINQNPKSEELANIAIDTAKNFKALTHAEPKVALLSHSTYGSASHPDVDKVVEATKIAKAKNSGFDIDGELQLDAAIVEKVGKQKAKGSTVAGEANVLIFPDIDAGNIGYKLVQRFAKADAFGPILQGLAKPVNDLSRGCSAEDIVAVAAFTVVQANHVE